MVKIEKKLRIDDVLIAILKREGNVVIPASLYKRYGENEIHNYCLTEFGLNVYLRIIQTDIPDFTLGDEVIISNLKKRRRKELTVIMELDLPIEERKKNYGLQRIDR